MRYLLFAPLVPLAFAIYFSVRRFFPKADPEEIYVMLVTTVIGAIAPSAILGVVCRMLEGRGIITMPSWVTVYAIGWIVTSLSMGGFMYADHVKESRTKAVRE
jgi:purine-cytosine permease-like protein